jgi:hypothetical protein
MSITKKMCKKLAKKLTVGRTPMTVARESRKTPLQKETQKQNEKTMASEDQSSPT